MDAKQNQPKTNGFEQPKAVRGDLPPSSDKEFWAPDGQLNAEQYNPDTRGAATVPTHGNFRAIGQEVYCTLCPNQHTLPVDLSKYDIINGRITRKA